MVQDNLIISFASVMILSEYFARPTPPLTTQLDLVSTFSYQQTYPRLFVVSL